MPASPTDPRDALAQRAHEWLTMRVRGNPAETWSRWADDFARYLTADGSRYLSPAQAAEQDRLLAVAHDALGGMYSWNDAYLDDDRNAHLWTVIAARILRQLTGRPARQPAALDEPATGEPER